MHIVEFQDPFPEFDPRMGFDMDMNNSFEEMRQDAMRGIPPEIKEMMEADW